MMGKRRFTICVDVDVSCDLDVTYHPDDGEVQVGPFVTRWLDPQTTDVTTLGVFLLEWANKGVLGGVEKDWYEALCEYLKEECDELCRS